MTVAVRPPRGPTIAANCFSIAEFARMLPVFDAINAKIELDRGMLIRLSPAKFPHSRVQGDIQYALLDLLRKAGSLLLVRAELSIRIGDDTIRVPDIAIFDNPGDEQDFVEASSVRLAVEISNDSLAYDLGARAFDYAIAGIADYWVVDVLASAVHLHSDPQAEGYAVRRVILLGQPLAAACLPEHLTVPGTGAATP